MRLKGASISKWVTTYFGNIMSCSTGVPCRTSFIWKLWPYIVSSLPFCGNLKHMFQSAHFTSGVSCHSSISVSDISSLTFAEKATFDKGDNFPSWSRYLVWLEVVCFSILYQVVRNDFIIPFKITYNRDHVWRPVKDVIFQTCCKWLFRY